MLGSIMFCISDPDSEIRQLAKSANQGLLSLVRTTKEAFSLDPLLQMLTAGLLSDHVTTRVAALNWINMLHEKDSVEMNKSFDELLPALLRALSDTADEVVLINLQVCLFLNCYLNSQRLLSRLLSNIRFWPEYA
jgi:vacuole morphology and inheritance protein 14